MLFQQGSGANQPPTANNDPGLSGFKNTTAQISASVLLANDTDPNGDPLTITAVGSPSNGTVSFNAQTNVVSFTPTTDFTGTASFNYTISDGRSGASTATATLNITGTPSGVGFFSTTQAPTNVAVSDPNPVELGMKFRVAQGGTITGVRFYKGPQNTGTHTGSLWNSTGTNLGTVTFTNESASGWQIASFANPIPVTAGTTYVVSYHSNGNYSADTGYFTSNISNGPITALASSGNGGNGVYGYGASAFPNSSFNASNYWVDAIFQPAASGPPTAVNDSGFSTQQNTPLHLTAASLLANDTDPNGDTLTITGVSAPTHGTVSFDAPSNSVTFTPTTGYTGAAQFTYSITDGNGGNSSANVSLNVTQPPSGAVSLFPNTATPSTVTVNDSGDVSLGMKFTASRTARSAASSSTRDRRMSARTRGACGPAPARNLGNVTFTNETASGWQTANVRHPDQHHRGADLRRLLPLAGLLFDRQRLLQHDEDQRPAYGALERQQRRQRALLLRQQPGLPDQLVQRLQLLGGRHFQPIGRVIWSRPKERLMQEELYADAIGEITVTGTIIRIDLVSLSATLKDASNQPVPQLRQRVVMSIEGFANSFDVLQKAMNGLIEAGAVKRVAPDTASVPRRAETNGARPGGSPNFA